MNLDVVVALCGTVAAVAVSQWPKLASILKRSPEAPVAPQATVSYQQAMTALAVVRGRLVATGGVSDEAGAAINVVTLALVAGSDR